jgi:alanyl-tRNA synthetase
MGRKSRARSEELRQVFLDFFRDRNHPILPASPLAPHDDPTLLFTTAGMVQFKPYYTAAGPIPYRRAATVQPCLRGSDLERVGVTTRHHTFFEMLGNFSFGDYFKEEAILWAWEFSTQLLGLPKEKIWASVYEADDEAAAIWEKKVGLDPRRIVRLGADDNFWGPAGDSGPCGPCSELYLDLGDGRGCGLPTCRAGCDCDRYIEFWNLVFPQYNQDKEGNRTPLPNRGVDTGMGLERLAQIMQGVESNFDTDLFVPILDAVRGFARGVDPAKDENLAASRVIADHARALVFAIHEGILPGNEGRGYVLRRILRRALLRASRLGIDDLFLDRVGEVVVDVMRGAYPALEESRARVAATIRAEEERFRRTLEQGLEIFRKTAVRLRRNGETVLPGGDVFRLYDTYGFPVELTEEMARAEGFAVDREPFEAAMEEQRTRSHWSAGAGSETLPDLSAISSEFVGYDTLETETAIAGLVREGRLVDSIGPSDEAIVILAESPFYGESGGQTGDAGEILNARGERLFLVRDAIRSPDDRALLLGKATATIRAGTIVRAAVEKERRIATARNHTATHLLHRALREVLGDHVRQAGSLVAPDRLRFDFVHFARMTEVEIGRVEARVNLEIQEDRAVRTEVVPFEEASRRGAVALFGEKYGDRVRMVSVEEYSLELCGGTHVRRTGEIGPFLIVSESAVGSGTRRIEAITGAAAFRKIQEDRNRLAHLQQLLRAAPEEIVARAEALQGRIQNLEKELARARAEGAGGRAGDLLASAVPVGDVRVLAAVVDGSDSSSLQGIVDRFQSEEKSLVAVLGTREEGKAFLVGMVSRDLVPRGLSAGDLVGRAARLVGGRGGGKPTFAQAGGKEPERLEETLRQVPEWVRAVLEGG